jgi:hypothetical protein
VGEIQEQVNTLRTDLMIPGPTISPWLTSTWIEVFIKYKEGPQQFTIMIQASTPLTSLVFESEAKALLDCVWWRGDE